VSIKSSSRDVHLGAATTFAVTTSSGTVSLSSTSGSVNIKASSNGNSIIDIGSSGSTSLQGSTVNINTATIYGSSTTGGPVTVTGTSVVTSQSDAYFGSDIATQLGVTAAGPVTLTGAEVDLTIINGLGVSDTKSVTISSPGGEVDIATRDFSNSGEMPVTITAGNTATLESRFGSTTVLSDIVSGSASNVALEGTTISIPSTATLLFDTEAFSATSGSGFAGSLTASNTLAITGSSFSVLSPFGSATQQAASTTTTISGTTALTALRGSVSTSYATTTFTALSSSVSAFANATINSAQLTITAGTTTQFLAANLVKFASPTITLTGTVGADFNSARDLTVTAGLSTLGLSASSSNIAIAADSSASFAGVTITTTATAGNVNIIGGDQSFITDASSGAGIFFAVTNGALSVTSSTSSISFLSTQFVRVNTVNLQSTQVHDVVLRGQPEQLTSSSSSYQFTAGNVFNSTGNTIALQAGGTSTFNATQNVSVFSGTLRSALTSITSPSGAFSATAGSVFGLSGGKALVKSDTSSILATVTGNLAIGSTYAGGNAFVTAKGNLGITSSVSIGVSNPTNLVLSTDFGASISVSATTQASFTAPSSNFTAPLFAYTAPQLLSVVSTTGVSLDGGSQNPVTLTATKNLFVRGTSEAILMSDGDMQLISTGPIESATQISTNDVYLRGFNQVSLTGTRIDVRSINAVNGTTTVTSGGAMSLAAAGDRFDINSAQDITTTVGGALEMHANAGTFYIQSAPLPTTGDIRFESHAGVFDSEALAGVTVNATGSPTHPISNIEMLIGGGLKVDSHRGGVALRSEGLVATARSNSSIITSPLAGAVIETYDNNGNIALTSDIDKTYLQAKQGITVATHGDSALLGVYGVDVTSGGILTFQSGGEFYVAGESGILVQAGSVTSPDDLVVKVARLVDVQAADTISIRSEGIVPVGIFVTSAFGDIRFATSNGNDISALAEKAMTWQVGGSLTALATEDISLVSYDGPTEFTAAQDLLFTTSGGPIVFDTHSGNGGAVTLQSIKNDVNVTSGGRELLSARRAFSFQANDGMQLGSSLGSSQFSADAPDSTVAIRAGGSLQVASTNYYADISFESANNFEAVATAVASLNAWKEITIGLNTRPLVRFFTGGSGLIEGYSVTSDGDLLVQSNRVIDINAALDFSVTADGRVNHLSYGPTKIKSTANTIDVRSDKGIASVFGNTLELAGDNGITAKTSGGVFSLISTGVSPGDGIELDAEFVRFDSNTLQANVTTLTGTTTTTFLLQAVNDGTIATSNGLGGTISMAADGAFTAVTADGALEIVSRRPYAPVTLTSTGAAATLTVKSEQENSPITFKSAGALLAKGNTVQVTSLGSVVDGIIVQALRTPTNNPDDTSDIEIYGSRNVAALASGRVDMIGEQGVYVHTDYIDNLGNGSPILIAAGRNLVIDSHEDINVATNPGDHASISLSAFDDIILSSSSVNGQPSNIGQVRFTADQNLAFVAQTEYTWFIDGALNTNVAGILSFSAAGRTNGFRRESINIQTEGVNNPLSFVSQRGSVLMSSFDTTTITAGDQTVNNAPIVITSQVGGSMTTKADSIYWTSAASATITAATDEVTFSTHGNLAIVSATGFSADASGKIDNSAWGLRVGSSGTASGNVIFNAGTTAAIQAQEGVELRGTNVDTTAGQGISFTSSALDAQTVFESANTLQWTAATGMTFTSTNQNIIVQATGSASISSGADLTITATGSTASFFTAPTAAGANVIAQSNWDVDVSAPTINVEATGEQGADVLVRNQYGRTNFVAAGGTINIQARDSNIAISAATYRQIVFNSPAINVRTGGPFALGGTNVATVVSPSITIANGADSIDFVSPGASVLVTGTNSVTVSSNGGMFLGASNTVTVNGNTGVTLTTTGRDQAVLVRANQGNLGLGTGSSILFRPTGATNADYATSFTTHSRFLIPFTSVPSVQHTLPCPVPRQLVYTTTNGNDGNLCVCTPYLGTDVAGASQWDCATVSRLNSLQP